MVNLENGVIEDLSHPDLGDDEANWRPQSLALADDNSAVMGGLPAYNKRGSKLVSVVKDPAKIGRSTGSGWSIASVWAPYAIEGQSIGTLTSGHNGTVYGGTDNETNSTIASVYGPSHLFQYRPGKDRLELSHEVEGLPLNGKIEKPIAISNLILAEDKTAENRQPILYGVGHFNDNSQYLFKWMPNAIGSPVTWLHALPCQTSRRFEYDSTAIVHLQDGKAHIIGLCTQAYYDFDLSLVDNPAYAGKAEIIQLPESHWSSRGFAIINQELYFSTLQKIYRVSLNR